MKRYAKTTGWLTALLTLTLLWVSPAMAVDYGLHIGATQVTDANCNDLSGIMGVTVASGGEFRYVPAEQTLFMYGVTLLVDVVNKNGIWNDNIAGLKIVIRDSYIKTKELPALRCDAATEITGSGQFVAECNGDHPGIFVSKTTLTISYIDLSTIGKWGIAGEDGESGETLNVKEAKVFAQGQEGGIADFAEFNLEGCEIVLPTGSKFDKTKHAVVDAEENKANRVTIDVSDFPVHIAGVQVNRANCNDLSGIAGVKVAAGGEFKYDPDSKTLVMKDVTVTADDKSAIYCTGKAKQIIVVSGANRLETKDVPTLDCSADTHIEGTGSLTIISAGSDAVNIADDKTLNIVGSTLEVSGNHGISGRFGSSNVKLILHDVNVTAKGVEGGILALASLELVGCNIVTPAGGKFDDTKRAVVDAGGKIANEVKIENPIAVTGVKLAYNDLTLKIGTSLKLVASVEPANAANKAVTWVSSDDAVATVSAKGEVLAKAEGKADITVTTTDGGHTATCSFTVTADDVVLTGLKITPTDIRIKVGQTSSLSVSYEPVTATHKEVMWETSDAAIVTVDANGNIQGVAAGEATITVKSKKDEAIKSTCKVVVESASSVEDTMFANIVVAPNPFSAQLRVVNGDLCGRYALYNAQGVVVTSGVLEGAETRINTSSFPAGIYLLRLSADNGAMQTYRVVKQ